MSDTNKRAHITKKGESRAHSAAHKFDGHKMANVVNHVATERAHGYESTKHHSKHMPEEKAH